MAYDIPQELRYKEIFAYGMTIRQFIYVILFGTTAVLILSLKNMRIFLFSESIDQQKFCTIRPNFLLD